MRGFISLSKCFLSPGSISPDNSGILRVNSVKGRKRGFCSADGESSIFCNGRKRGLASSVGEGTSISGKGSTKDFFLYSLTDGARTQSSFACSDSLFFFGASNPDSSIVARNELFFKDVKGEYFLPFFRVLFCVTVNWEFSADLRPFHSWLDVSLISATDS